MNSCQEHEYIDLGLPSGTLWAACNVGANTPEGYGDYFAWGEIQYKTRYDWATYKYSKTKKRLFKEVEVLLTKYCRQAEYGYEGFTDRLTELQASDDAAVANWGNGWRTPPMDQWDELLENTSNKWTTQNGVKGRLFTAKNGQTLFLPAAGYRWDSELHLAGAGGYYWSRSLLTDSPGSAWSLYFDSDDCYVGHGYRDTGFSVRPVRQN